MYLIPGNKYLYYYDLATYISSFSTDIFTPNNKSDKIYYVDRYITLIDNNIIYIDKESSIYPNDCILVPKDSLLFNKIKAIKTDNHDPYSINTTKLIIMDMKEEQEKHLEKWRKEELPYLLLNLLADYSYENIKVIRNENILSIEYTASIETSIIYFVLRITNDITPIEVEKFKNKIEESITNKIRKQALAKLTEQEKQILGLINYVE